MRTPSIFIVVMALALFATSTSPAQESNLDNGGQPEQDLKNSQWSFQGTWVTNVSSHDQTLATGETRPAGPRAHLQARVAWRVTPKSLPTVPIVSRLKLQRTRSQNGEWGIAPTELFTLALPGTWNSGQFGIGPLARFPVSNPEFGDTEYTFGFSTGVIQRFDKYRLLVGLLIRQTWGKSDPLDPGALVAQPMALNPVINLRLGGGYYIQNGGMVGLLNWQRRELYFPLALRVGRVIVTRNGSWNISGEYKTSGQYKNWSGPAVKHAFRLNVGYSFKGSPDLLAVFD